MRFYAYPPKEIDYPYILRNIKQKSIHPNIVHEIVDIGIHDLLKTKDHMHTEKRLFTWKTTSLLPGNWKVVPDCPDLKNEFKIKTSLDNVEYSKTLLLELFNPDNDSQLPVIQCYYNQPDSAYDFCKFFKREFPGYETKFGIGTLCRSNNKELAIKTCKIVRKEFPQAWIHAFGTRLHHVSALIGIINSFDSSAWTFPRGRGRGSAKNKQQRIDYFYEYLVRI